MKYFWNSFRYFQNSCFSLPLFCLASLLTCCSGSLSIFLSSWLILQFAYSLFSSIFLSFLLCLTQSLHLFFTSQKNSLKINSPFSYIFSSLWFLLPNSANFFFFFAYSENWSKELQNVHLIFFDNCVCAPLIGGIGDWEWDKKIQGWYHLFQLH